MTGVAVACVAVLGASVVQSATGFGFALVAVPVLAAVFGPLEAVSTVALLGLVVNALTLTTERRPLAVLGPTAAGLVAWSLPGMAAGALLIASVRADVVRLLVAAAVLAAVGVHIWAARARRRGDEQVRVSSAGAGRATAGAGLLAGALSTSTGLNGPPLVLHLLRRGADAAHQRDTLAAVFLATGVLTLAALATAGVLRIPSSALVLLAGAALGQGLGRRAFPHLAPHHEAVSLAVLAFSALAALLPAAQALL